jgi:hypothetical protein
MLILTVDLGGSGGRAWAALDVGGDSILVSGGRDHPTSTGAAREQRGQ